VVEGTGLENRHTGNGIVSSNLTLSVQDPTRWPCRRVVVWRGAGDEQVLRTPQGRVAEWFKAHAWKVCVRS
jgi:hypothetical protein